VHTQTESLGMTASCTVMSEDEKQGGRWTDNSTGSTEADRMNETDDDM
jgi:hypothetical protein